MTAAEQQTVDILVRLVETNDKRNSADHAEIKSLISALQGEIRECGRLDLSLKTVGKFLLGVLGTAGTAIALAVGLQHIIA